MVVVEEEVEGEWLPLQVPLNHAAAPWPWVREA